MKKQTLFLLLALGAIVLLANSASAATPRPHSPPIGAPTPINPPNTSPT